MARGRCATLFVCVVVAFALALVCASRVAWAEPARLELVPGAIIGRGEDGAERWVIRHPGWRDANDELRAPVGPLAHAGRAFYAVGDDLLELDTGHGKILRRTRLPAPIAAIAAGADAKHLALTLDAKTSQASAASLVTIVFAIDGPFPGRGPWGGVISNAWQPRRDALRLAPGYDREHPQTLDARARELAVAALRAQEAADPTNPFLPLIRGELLALSGDTAGAKTAFGVAADLPDAWFADLLAVSTMLEEDDARDEARRAFARGLADMKDAGIRVERLQGLIGFTEIAGGAPRRAMDRALAKGDVERADEIQRRIAALCPRIEMAPVAWRDFAKWERDHGRADLAAAWSARANDADKGSVNAGATMLLTMDLVTPFTLACVVAFPVFVLIAGVRANVERRRRGDRARLVPKPRGVDLVAALLPLAAGLVLGAIVNANVIAIGRQVSMPVALTQDGFAAPEAVAWLAALPASDARDRALAYARAEAEAFRRGSRADVAAPDDATLVAAARTVPWTDRFRGAATQDVELYSPRWWLASLVAALVAYLVGALLGGWRATTAIVTTLTPGAGAAFRPFGAVAFGYVLAAALSLAGFDAIIEQIALPSYGRFFGLESIATSVDVSRPHAWAVAAIVAIVALHAVVVMIEASRERARLRQKSTRG